MADNKKSFILYADMIHTVKKMTKQKAGELFMTILSYVNDENPVVTDKIIDLVFEPIKHQLKRDLMDWEETKSERSNSGKLGNLKRWNKDLYKKVVSNEISIEEAVKIAKDRYATKGIAKIAVTDNVTVTVKESKEKICAPDFKNNLNRTPNIPNREEVQLCFMQNGGNYEMANSFYDRCEATEWFFKGSPIINFRSMVNSFVTNWNKNLNGKFAEKSTSAPLKYASDV